jgi:predicted cupin superfamily sugar epimerase
MERKELGLAQMTADQIIAQLNLTPHPEGGHYRQTWIADAPEGTRPAGTAIYFLLKADEGSHWHRVDAAEIWHYYAGAPLTLSLAATEAGPAQDLTLGSDLAAGQLPQQIVPPHHWQAARSTGDWTLVGCTVSPAFQFEGFELAAPGFDIPR